MGTGSFLWPRRATSCFSYICRRPLLHGHGCRRSSTHSIYTREKRGEDDQQQSTHDYQKPTGPTDNAQGQHDGSPKSPTGLLRHAYKLGQIPRGCDDEDIYEELGLVFQEKEAQEDWYWALPVRDRRTSVSVDLRYQIQNRIIKPDAFFEASEPPARTFYTVRMHALNRGRPPPTRKALNRDGWLALLSYSYDGEYTHPDWYHNIGELHRMKRSELPGITAMSPAEKWSRLKVQDWETVSSWATAITAEAAELSEPRYAQRWKTKVAPGDRAERWPNIALWLLLNSPQDVTAFLRATCYNKKRPPFAMVADCFHYLHVHYGEELLADPSSREQFLRHMSACLHPMRWPSIAPRDHGIRLYTQYCDRNQLASAFHYTLRWEMTLSIRALGYFVDRLIEARHYRYALKALHRMLKSKSPRPDDFDFQIWSRCTKLLMFDTVKADRSRLMFPLLSSLLKMGIQPNQAMLNVVLRNALRIGDHRLVWDLYDHMQEHDSINSHAVVGLLDSAMRCRDVGNAMSLLQYIDDRPSVLHHPFVVSQILSTIASFSLDYRCKQFPRYDMFNEMLRYYRRVHDVRPLSHLEIMPQAEEMRPSGPGRKPRSPPSEHALNLMVFAFLQCQIDYTLVRRTFYRFLELVHQGHSYFAPLAESEYIFNAFLMGFMRHPALLNDCVSIVDGMLHPPADMTPLETQPPRAIKQAEPTIKTWTILLSAFLWHRQPGGALRVREMMTKRGIKFNRVSWNIMIRGFSKMQLSEEVAACLKMMEQEKWTWDTQTESAVGLLKDRVRFDAAWRDLDSRMPSEHLDPTDDNSESLQDIDGAIGQRTSKDSEHDVYTDTILDYVGDDGTVEGDYAADDDSAVGRPPLQEMS